MASFEFDNVKAEKEDALWRYNMERKFNTGLRLTGFSLPFFLFSWSWFPTLIPGTLQVAGDFQRRLVSKFNEPCFTFFLLNFIIFVVYILSSQKQTQKQANSTDIYDDYAASSRRSIPTSADATAAEESVDVVVDKQVVLVENAAHFSPKQLETAVDTVTETNISFSPVTQPTTMTNRTVLPIKTEPAVPSTTEVNDEKEYRRTQSILVSESIIQGPVEFLSSETATGGGELVSSGIESPRKSMEEMSNEEFQSIIDTFIEEKKKTLRQENTQKKRSKRMSILEKN